MAVVVVGSRRERDRSRSARVAAKNFFASRLTAGSSFECWIGFRDCFKCCAVLCTVVLAGSLGQVYARVFGVVFCLVVSCRVLGVVCSLSAYAAVSRQLRRL